MSIYSIDISSKAKKKSELLQAQKFTKKYSATEDGTRCILNSSTGSFIEKEVLLLPNESSCSILQPTLSSFWIKRSDFAQWCIYKCPRLWTLGGKGLIYFFKYIYYEYCADRHTALTEYHPYMISTLRNIIFEGNNPILT